MELITAVAPAPWQIAEIAGILKLDTSGVHRVVLPERTRVLVLKVLLGLCISQANTLTYNVCPLLTGIDNELKLVVADAPVEMEKLLPIFVGEVNATL